MTKRACIRCGGVGTEAGSKCIDCRGDGWRPIDNEVQ